MGQAARLPLHVIGVITSDDACRHVSSLDATANLAINCELRVKYHQFFKAIFELSDLYYPGNTE